MASRRRSRQSGPPVPAIVGGVVLLLLIAGGIWWWQRDPGPDAEPPAPAPVAEETGPVFDDREVPPLDLPELGASDEFVRRMVGGLSAHPQLARWLVTDELVHRFVGVVVDLAGGSNPAEHVRHMAPGEPFRVQEVDGRTVIHPDSYRRYDLLTATFVSLDTEGTVRLYRQMRPLIEEAYADLGIPDYSFDQTLALAIRNLLAVDVPSDPPQVVRVEGVYEFANPVLEGRRGAEKAMMRMGPENARRVQEKLREFAGELGLQVN